MIDDNVQPEPDLRVILIPAPDDAPLSSSEYQKELGEFFQSLQSQGVKASARCYVRDAVGAGGGLTGTFVIVAATLGNIAIVQARKAIEAFLKHRDKRKLKLEVGGFRVEGYAPDVKRMFEQLESSEHFQKLLKAKNSETGTH
jgi:hypothetical protein